MECMLRWLLCTLSNRLQLYYWLVAVGSVPMMVFQWLKLEGVTSSKSSNGKLLLHRRQLESELSYRSHFAWQANRRHAAQPSRTDSRRGLLFCCQCPALYLLLAYFAIAVLHVPLLRMGARLFPRR